MSYHLGIKVEHQGETVTGEGSCVVKYQDMFFILCVLSAISPEQLEKDGFHALLLPDASLVYLMLDEVIAWHERALAATDGKLGDRAHLARLVALREALRDGRESCKEVMG